MAEFIAFDPNVEVAGASASADLAALQRLGVDAIPIFEKYGLYPLEADQWYNQQAFLNAYKEIAQTTSLSMTAIGMQVPEVVEFPPDIKTIEDVLQALNEAYQMNHRGGEFGEYQYVSTGERSAKMVCRNPYPSEFDYGLIYKLLQLYRPEDSKDISIELDTTAPTRKAGADSCTYLVRW